ncbi:hypothetical protein C5Y96_22140 [Blastopirellula marina]|uniref:G protein-coupled receptor LGR4 n=1 Tax=Blastopirellula marina TaxID=124 RepID=A0A2S8F1X7_9BACT|nr:MULTISPECIES: hypothetical protein [Pirellulaceae]PQO26149.1 hypothetical protein C5Y96_22140 [Blastopirellula marina]RCS44508.1 hypothetical protein DTL36_22185 [Bremerella cremea]
MKTLFSLLIVLTPVLVLAAEPDQAAFDKINAKVQVRDGAVYSLSANCDGYTDQEYQLIGQLKTLKSLSLSGKELNDEQLKMLSGLKNLESFMINGSVLTDDGYQHFTAFPKLTKLSIFHPSRKLEGFNGSGLAHLKAMPQLRSLTFAGATAGNEALEAVGQLTQLESFREWHNTETSDGLKHLAKLTNLKSVRLGQRLPNWGKETPASFNNDSIAVLAKIPSLESIELTEARLNYDAVAQLKDLPNLKMLIISQVDISEADVEKLKAAMPSVEIKWEPLTDEQTEMLTKKLRL